MNMIYIFNIKKQINLDIGNKMLNIREKNKIQNLNSSVFVIFLHFMGQ